LIAFYLPAKISLDIPLLSSVYYLPTKVRESSLIWFFQTETI